MIWHHWSQKASYNVIWGNSHICSKMVKLSQNTMELPTLNENFCLLKALVLKKTYETLNCQMVCDYDHFVLITAPGKPKAGKYGDYQCDIPAITFESMLQHISSTHQVQIYGVLISVLSVFLLGCTLSACSKQLLPFCGKKALIKRMNWYSI